MMRFATSSCSATPAPATSCSPIMTVSCFGLACHTRRSASLVARGVCQTAPTRRRCHEIGGGEASGAVLLAGRRPRLLAHCASSSLAASWSTKAETSC